MSVDELIATAERAAKVARTIADQLREAGLEVQARLLDHVARALEAAARGAIAAPSETPPTGLLGIIDEMAHPSALVSGLVVRDLAHRYVRGRSLVRRLLAAAEIAGDVEVVAEAQAWLAED